MLRLARVQASDHVVDLGAGDGQLVVAAAQLGVRLAEGYELDTHLAEVAAQRIQRLGLSNARVLNENALQADLSPASVVCLYLSDSGNKQVLPIILQRAQNPPPLRVVSLHFPLPPEVTPVQTDRVDGLELFLYEFGALSQILRA